MEDGGKFISRRYIFVRYDFTYMAIEVILTFIILIGLGLAFLYGPKIEIEDPIGNIKSIFLGAQAGVMLIELFLMWQASSDSENKRKMLSNIEKVLVISLIAMFVLLGIKLYMDSTYTNEKFEDLYVEDMVEGKNTDIPLGNYIKESTDDYYRFKIKTIIFFLIQLFIIFMNIYMVIKVIPQSIKESELEKNDKIVYDEEINIKN